MSNIKELIENVEITFNEEIKKAKADYVERINAIDEFYKMPDIVFQLGGGSPSILANGALEEARKVQSQCGRNMEKALDSILKEMESYKGKTEKAGDILLLSDKLKGWILRFEELNIPASKHTASERYLVNKDYRDALSKWEKYCESDPIVRHEVIKQRKQEYTIELDDLKRKQNELNQEYHTAESELHDRQERYESDVEAIINETKQKMAEIDSTLEREEKDLELKEDLLRDLNSKLMRLGLFAVSEKKATKQSIIATEDGIRDIRERLKLLEREKVESQNSKNARIKSIDSSIESLKNRMTNASKRLNDLEEPIKKLETTIADLVID